MKYIIRIIVLIIFSCTTILHSKPPRLTIVLIIDQCAQHLIKKLEPNFTGAFKQLLKNGIVYEQANFPHAMPATSTGHTALSTGAYAHNHGIIGNHWYDKQGQKKLKCYADNTQDAAVFALNGLYDKGVSAKNLLVDGLSDQYMLSNKNHEKSVYAFSLKPRAAVGVSNHRGKPIWFDSGAGRMTSSKAFFYELPRWLDRFNTTHTIAPHRAIKWRLVHPAASKFYQFKHARDDRFSEFDVHVGRRTVALNLKPSEKKSKYTKIHKWFEITPQANQYVLDCAYEYIRKELPNHENMLVWISLSSLDKIGHRVGSHNIATLDMLYHLDKQINTFMKSVDRLVRRKEPILYVLTGDHGGMPIPELLAQDGYPAKRINTDTLITKLNAMLQEKFGIESLVKKYKTPQFFLDEVTIKSYPKEKQTAILHEIKQLLLATPDIKQVWTFDELQNKTYPPHSFEEHFKQQLYPGRSGLITVQPHPYILLTDYHLGTAHKTPYNYDTQVPLIFYQKNVLEKKRIPEQVWAPQVTATLAHLLEIPRPSAATFDMLPRIEMSK